MVFKKENYIKSEIDSLASNDFDCIYCYCDIATIPLETFYDLESIPKSQETQGNLIWLKESEFPVNHFIYTNGQWCPAIITGDKELYTEVQLRARQQKIDGIID